MKPDIAEVHPELQSSVNKIPPFTFASWNLRLMRFLIGLQPVPKPPENVSVENVFISIADHKAKIRLRIYKPNSLSLLAPALLWLHGGGYIIGRPELSEATCIQYVRELGIVIVSVDYRLAPDYPFPTPLEDSYAALKWLYEHANELKIDPTRIAIGGESAGAGLAASLVQLAVDRNEIKPIFQLLIYPMLDNQTTVRKDLADKGHFGWSQGSNRYGWKSYLGKDSGSTELPAYAVPSRRDDLSKLPPAWIGVGTLDLFYDEDVAYAQKLRACGVECELVEVPGAFHGFDFMAPQSKVVRDFQNAQIAALKRYLLPPRQSV